MKAVILKAIALFTFIIFFSPAHAASNGSIPVYNVKLPPYNAVGDGIADDSIAIQNAINDAGAGGSGPGVHGTVYLPAGNYKVTSTLAITSSFITVEGAGGLTQQSNIAFQPSLNTPLFDIQSGGSSGWDVEISHLHLIQVNGSGGGSLIRNTAATGATNMVIDDCSLEDRNTSNTADLLYSELSNTFIRNSGFNSVNQYQYSIHFRKVDDPVLNINSTVSDSGFGGSGKGILVDKVSSSTGGQAEGLKVTRNTFLNVGSEQITIYAAFHANISENILDQTQYLTIWLAAYQGQVDGIIISNNYFGAHSSAGGEVGVQSTVNGSNPLSNIIISGNRFFGGRYGIVVPPSATRWVIANNVMHGNGSAGSTGIVFQGSANNGLFNVTGNIVDGYVTNFYAVGATHINNVANWFQ